MRTGFVVEAVVENCPCKHPRLRLVDADPDLFEVQTEDYDHYVDERIFGRCRKCGADLLLDIHFVVTEGKRNNVDNPDWSYLYKN
jgi:hypothetical protein|tara:strand:- start:929 stop:1183 length:255 start_codon:yes stop_codon:yes gene_type:complete